MARNIFALGETTYDIIFKNEKPIDAKVGGSQLNTTISLGRMGLNVYLISQYGTDKVGQISGQFLEANKVSTQYITRYDGNSRVALAFLDEENNADYTFFKPEIKTDIKFPDIRKGDIILFGSSYAIKAQIRQELIPFLKKAGEKGAIIIYDPNFRKAHLKDLPKVKPLILENMALADVVKGSDEDFHNIFGAKDFNSASESLQNHSQALLVYTANKFGVDVTTPRFKKHFDIEQIKPLSTIGAGDTFNAGLIFSIISNRIAKQGLQDIKSGMWEKITNTAVLCAQHVCLSYDNYISEEFAREVLSI